jgi:hypothetical protein
MGKGAEQYLMGRNKKGTIFDAIRIRLMAPGTKIAARRPKRVGKGPGNREKAQGAGL